MAIDNGDKPPLEKFEEFVSEILSVTKDDIKKIEDEERRLKDLCEPPLPAEDAD